MKNAGWAVIMNEDAYMNKKKGRARRLWKMLTQLSDTDDGCD